MGRIRLRDHVDAEVKSIPRIDALYYFVYELAECFHADEETLDRIKIGVLENQIIRRLTLLYKCSGQIVGKLIIHIDWDKHYTLVEMKGGKCIEYDSSKSLVDNIVKWRKIAVTHIEKLMDEYNVDEVDSVFLFRSKYYADDEVYAKTRKIMKTEPQRSNANKKVEIDNELQDKINNILAATKRLDEKSVNFVKRSFSCGEFEEVQVETYYKRKY